jgi:SWI/SNF-related matrix-associated actin-dependent regulator of chromatin subfamily A containing DEAD/H box 1
MGLRPFPDAADFNSKVSRRNKTGISSHILTYCTEMFRGYKSVDDVLEGCERVGDQLKEAISKWTHNPVPTASTSQASTPFDDNDGALALDALPVGEKDLDADYISTQPSLLADTVQLKEYQLLGVNWLNLLYRRNLSCILADEMGACTPYTYRLC